MPLSGDENRRRIGRNNEKIQRRVKQSDIADVINDLGHQGFRFDTPEAKFVMAMLFINVAISSIPQAEAAKPGVKLGKLKKYISDSVVVSDKEDLKLFKNSLSRLNVKQAKVIATCAASLNQGQQQGRSGFAIVPQRNFVHDNASARLTIEGQEAAHDKIRQLVINADAPLFTSDSNKKKVVYNLISSLYHEAIHCIHMHAGKSALRETSDTEVFDLGELRDGFREEFQGFHENLNKEKTTAELINIGRVFIDNLPKMRYLVRKSPNVSSLEDIYKDKRHREHHEKDKICEGVGKFVYMSLGNVFKGISAKYKDHHKDAEILAHFGMIPKKVLEAVDSKFANVIDGLLKKLLSDSYANLNDSNKAVIDDIFPHHKILLDVDNKENDVPAASIKHPSTFQSQGYGPHREL